MKNKTEHPLHFHKPTSFLITPIQLEDSEGRRNDYYTKAECCYKKEENKIMLKPQNDSAEEKPNQNRELQGH